MNEPVFLTREAVDLIHADSLREFGGGDGLRDENALGSALAQPMNEFLYREADLFQIAAAYAYHIAENQPYIDGNKRTGLLSALNFLAANGIVADQPVDEFYDAMIAIAAKRLDKAGARRGVSREALALSAHRSVLQEETEVTEETSQPRDSSRPSPCRPCLAVAHGQRRVGDLR